MTQAKGDSMAQLPPLASPFRHKTLTSISKRTKWPDIENLIKGLLILPEF